MALGHDVGGGSAYRPTLKFSLYSLITRAPMSTRWLNKFNNLPKLGRGLKLLDIKSWRGAMAGQHSCPKSWGGRIRPMVPMGSCATVYQEDTRTYEACYTCMYNMFFTGHGRILRLQIPNVFPAR